MPPRDEAKPLSCSCALCKPFRGLREKPPAPARPSSPSAHVPVPCCQGTALVVMFIAPPWVYVSTSIDALGRQHLKLEESVPCVYLSLSGTGEAQALLCSHNTPPPCWRDAQKEDGGDTARHRALCHSQPSQQQQTPPTHLVIPPTIHRSSGWLTSAGTLWL